VVRLSAALVLARGWPHVAAFLNGAWPPWVSNVANVVQLSGPPIALLAVWLTRSARSHSTEPGAGVAARLLGLLALLLPARDRERFVGEVLANMAGLRWRQRAVGGGRGAGAGRDRAVGAAAGGVIDRIGTGGLTSWSLPVEVRADVAALRAYSSSPLPRGLGPGRPARRMASGSSARSMGGVGRPASHMR